MAMSVTYVVWMVGLHSIIHGIFGLVFVMTSDYVNKSPEINYSLAALYGLLILLGLLVFCVLVCRLPICAIMFGVLFAVLALAIIVLSIIYTIRYWPFFANSVLDKLFFYSDSECWVGPDHKMTIWHFFTILFCILPLLWLLVYACLLCKYARCVCCIPCPPRSCYKPPPCPPPCCIKERWYKKILRSKCPAYPPPPPCPQTNTPLCSPCPPPCPIPCPPPCPPPCPKKTPKFVLTLRPGKMTCK